MDINQADKRRLDDLTDRLSTYYKEVLDGFTMNDAFTLEHELRIAKDFLEMTALAEHSEAYSFDVHALSEKDEIAKATLPPLIITTFLENAYEHGIRGYNGSCEISVKLKEEARGKYLISIENTGRRMQNHEFLKIQESIKPENLAKHRLELSATDTILHGGRTGRGIVNALARIYLFNKLNRKYSISITYDKAAHQHGYTKVLLTLKLPD